MTQALDAIYQSFIPPPAGWVLVFLILIVALWAGWSLWSEYQRLHLERNQVLATAKREIKQARESEDPIERLTRWAVYSQLQHTLTARAVKAVLAIREARNPDMEATLTMLDYSEASRLNLARNAPNWILLIGIAGTVIGLASAVIPLAPQIQAAIGAADPTFASQSMAETLEAMRHAFACSLWGIFMAVAVSVGTRVVTSKQQQTIAEVQEFVLNEVARAVLPKSEAVQLEDIQRTLRSGRQFLQRISGEIERVTGLMQQAAHNFGEVLNTTVQEMKQIGMSLSQSAESIQRTLLQATDSVQESTERLVQSTDRLQESSDKLREYHKNLRDAYEQLVRLYDQSKKDLEEVVERQIEQIRGYREAIEQLANRVVERLMNVSTDLSDSQKTFDDARMQVIQSAEEIRNAIKAAFNEFQSGIGAILEQHRKQMVEVEARLREMILRLEQIGASSESAVDVVRKARQLLEELRDFLQRDGALITLQSLYQSVSRIASILENLQQRSSAFQVADIQSKSREVDRTSAVVDVSQNKSSSTTDEDNKQATNQERGSWWWWIKRG